MRNFKLGLLILISFTLIQCKFESNSIDRLNDKGVSLKGKQERGNNSHHFIWSVKVIDRDSIVLLSSSKQNKEDITLNNRQFYGKLKASEKYTFEIFISKSYYVAECDKPSNKYLGTDTIPFFTNSLMLKEAKYWDLIRGENKFRLDKPYFLYKTDSKLMIPMKLVPNENSGLYPVKIKTGLGCGVYLMCKEKRGKTKYFLNNNKGEYEFIISDKYAYEKDVIIKLKE